MTTFRELGRKVKKQLSYVERNTYPHQLPVSKYIPITGILKLISILVGVKSSLSSPRDRERCVALWGQQIKQESAAQLKEHYTALTLSHHSHFPPSSLPRKVGMQQLQQLLLVLNSGEFMLSSSEECRPQDFAFSTPSFSTHRKQNWKERARGQTFQVLIPQNVAPAPVSWLIQVMTHPCQQGRLPSCVTVPPVLDNNELMLCKRVQ